MAFRSLKAEEWTNKNPKNPPKSIYPQAGTYTYNDYIFFYNVPTHKFLQNFGALFLEIFWEKSQKMPEKCFWGAATWQEWL